MMCRVSRRLRVPNTADELARTVTVLDTLECVPAARRDALTQQARRHVCQASPQRSHAAGAATSARASSRKS
jgi:hypothetical protein